MKRLTLAATLTLLATQAMAFNLNDAVNAASTLQNGNQNGAAVSASPKAAGLLNTLGTQLNVTPEQAVGGTGAMLGLAKNKLQPSQYAELTQKVPGLDKLSGANALGSVAGLSGMLGQEGNASALNSALGNVQSTGDVNNAFGKLGMNTGMVSQFAPIILQYLGQQGTSGGTLQSLAGLWGVKP